MVSTKRKHGDALFHLANEHNDGRSSTNRPCAPLPVLQDQGRGRQIVIRNVPTNVPFSILTNALGLYFSQALGLSLKFVNISGPSRTYCHAPELVHFLSFPEERVVGHLFLVPRPSTRYPGILHTEDWGYLQIPGCASGRKQDNKLSTVENIISTLMHLVQDHPLLLQSSSGRTFTVNDLWFQVVEQDVRDSEQVPHSHKMSRTSFLKRAEERNHKTDGTKSSEETQFVSGNKITGSGLEGLGSAKLPIVLE